MKSTRSTLSAVLIATFLMTLAVTKPVEIQSGKLEVVVKQAPNSSPQPFRVSYDSAIKSEIKLIQSSTIEIEAKVKFSNSSFHPEQFTFRIVHSKYDKLSQPVQATYDPENEVYKCLVDLGDPKTIQPYSDVYRLELIIADEQLSANVRNTIATIRINFKYSIPEEKIPNQNSPISYKLENIIRTDAPEQRVDPPATFTLFVVIVMGVFTVLFFYGVFGHLKANFRLLPSDGLGLLLNLALISLLAVNLVFLGKFWLSWNFITTFVNLFWLIIATALVANYALLYMKNRQ